MAKARNSKPAEAPSAPDAADVEVAPGESTIADPVPFDATDPPPMWPGEDPPPFVATPDDPVAFAPAPTLLARVEEPGVFDDDVTERPYLVAITADVSPRLAQRVTLFGSDRHPYVFIRSGSKPITERRIYMAPPAARSLAARGWIVTAA